MFIVYTGVVPGYLRTYLKILHAVIDTGPPNNRLFFQQIAFNSLSFAIHSYLILRWLLIFTKGWRRSPHVDKKQSVSIETRSIPHMFVISFLILNYHKVFRGWILVFLDYESYSSSSGTKRLTFIVSSVFWICMYTLMIIHAWILYWMCVHAL